MTSARTCARVAAVALLSMTSAGCGSNTPADSRGTESTIGRGSLAFAHCMRDNGVGEFPDPDASGQLTIEHVANGAAVDTDSPAFERAMRACKDLAPAGFTGHERNPAQQRAAVAFAQCIREHGVKDFPDPAPDDPLVDTNKIPSTDTDDGMTLLNAAMGQCGQLAEAAGVTGGR